MNFIRTALPAAAAAGLVLAGMGALPAQADDSSARGPGDLCKVRVLSVQADNLQEDIQEQDEIFLRLGDARTVQRPYFLGQKRNTLGDGEDHFTGIERVRLVEHDIGANDVIDSGRLECRTGQVTSTLNDSTADTVYTVVWRVDVIS